MKKRENREIKHENVKSKRENVKFEPNCKNCYYYQNDYCWSPPFLECEYVKD